MMIRRLLEKYQKLQKRHEDFLKELELSSVALTDYHPVANGWNMLQVGHHLFLSEKLTLQYMKKKILGFSPEQKVALLTHVKFRFFVWGLRLPVRAKIPTSAVAPEANISLTDLKAEWRALDQKFQQFLLKFEKRHLAFPVYKHPLVGRITITETIDFLNGHFTHHMWQIKRIRKAYENHLNTEHKTGE